MAEKGGHWVKSAGGGMSFLQSGGASAVSAFAKSIADKGVEHVAVFDDAGRLLVHKEGGKSRAPAIGGKGGAVAIHNHPSGTPYFSRADLQGFGITPGLTETIIVGVRGGARWEARLMKPKGSTLSESKIARAARLADSRHEWTLRTTRDRNRAQRAWYDAITQETGWTYRLQNNEQE